jgi:hypothetical protein
MSGVGTHYIQLLTVIMTQVSKTFNAAWVVSGNGCCWDNQQPYLGACRVRVLFPSDLMAPSGRRDDTRCKGVHGGR